MVNLIPTITLAQSISKRKFPSIDKPLQKEPLKNISSEAYFRNFTVAEFDCKERKELTVKYLGSSNILPMSEALPFSRVLRSY